MRLEIAAICEAATEQGGKLNMLGAFDTLYASAFPHTLPQCTFVFRIRFNRAESGDHSIKLTLKDSNGVPLIPEMNAKVPITIQEGSDGRVGNILMNVHGLKFQNPGYHAVDLSLDGTHTISLPIRVLEVNPQQPPMSPGEL